MARPFTGVPGAAGNRPGIHALSLPTFSLHAEGILA
jgi:hypothetical protein